MLAIPCVSFFLSSGSLNTVDQWPHRNVCKNKNINTYKYIFPLPENALTDNTTWLPMTIHCTNNIYCAYCFIKIHLYLAWLGMYRVFFFKYVPPPRPNMWSNIHNLRFSLSFPFLVIFFLFCFTKYTSPFCTFDGIVF